MQGSHSLRHLWRVKRYARVRRGIAAQQYAFEVVSDSLELQFINAKVN